MEAWVVFYKMKGLQEKTRSKVLTRLFGKKQKSNHGRYQYQIKGIIPEDSYIKPVRAVLIVKKKYLQRVSKLFDSYQIEYRIFEIKVQRSDFEKKPFL